MSPPSTPWRADEPVGLDDRLLVGVGARRELAGVDDLAHPAAPCCVAAARDPSSTPTSRDAPRIRWRHACGEANHGCLETVGDGRAPGGYTGSVTTQLLPTVPDRTRPRLVLGGLGAAYLVVLAVAYVLTVRTLST